MPASLAGEGVGGGPPIAGWLVLQGSAQHFGMWLEQSGWLWPSMSTPALLEDALPHPSMLISGGWLPCCRAFMVVIHD